MAVDSGQWTAGGPVTTLAVIMPRTETQLLWLALALGALPWAAGCRAPHVQTPADELGQLRATAAVHSMALQHSQRRLQRARASLRRLATVYRVARGVVQVRGLRLRRPLDVRTVNRAFVQRFVGDTYRRELGASYIDGYVATMARLGALPKGFPFIRSLQDLLGEQGAGFFDPHTKRLYLQQDIPAEEVILAHEIGHALQDQHFDLERIHGDPKGDDDRGFAVSALIEGDAMELMTNYVKHSLDLWRGLKLVGSLLQIGAMDQRKLQATPLYIREYLTGTYMVGWAFVQALRARGGLAQIDRAFRKPPVSSEQVLHPAKYFANERPMAVVLPALEPVLGPGWKLLHENTIGEFGTSLLLRGSVQTALSARRAAAGWGGDRLRSYRHGDGRLALVWRTRWDTVNDAQDFAGVFSDYLAAHLERPSRAQRTPWRRSWQLPQRNVLLLRRGADVVLLDLPRTVDQAAAVGALGLRKSRLP